ncbi:19697_t:CDS:2 [Rhizophagus irregularis]|nr:19697_t:CDS:2 [Rhizophagus irregularis]
MSEWVCFLTSSISIHYHISIHRVRKGSIKLINHDGYIPYVPSYINTSTAEDERLERLLRIVTKNTFRQKNAQKRLEMFYY